ncbi:MAG: hypothetical protein GY790_10945 [Bacteroidetes bacterium]|nr:hypothetical protein [Bacteroidota bacterium]
MGTAQIQVWAPEHFIYKHVVNTIMLYELSGLKTTLVFTGYHIRMLMPDYRPLVLVDDYQFLLGKKLCDTH